MNDTLYLAGYRGTRPRDFVYSLSAAGVAFLVDLRAVSAGAHGYAKRALGPLCFEFGIVYVCEPYPRLESRVGDLRTLVGDLRPCLMLADSEDPVLAEMARLVACPETKVGVVPMILEGQMAFPNL